VTVLNLDMHTVQKCAVILTLKKFILACLNMERNPKTKIQNVFSFILGFALRICIKAKRSLPWDNLLLSKWVYVGVKK
jgi:hypothetical protein